MAEVYIRTPDRDESRGPFNEAKLASLAEVGQITPNTLYYDESKEEWIPIALNEELKAAVFPAREKLSLKMGTERRRDDEAVDPKSGKSEEISVEAMLAAAKGKTSETKHRQDVHRSADRAAGMSAPSLGLMMLLSAIFLILPHLSLLKVAIEDEAYTTIFNYPFVLVGLFDLLMAIFLFLAVTEIYPLLRARAMLALGFGLYVAWAIGDFTLIAVFAAAALGVFIATITQRFPIMLAAVVLGIAGNAYLAYLSITGRFSGFFEGYVLSLF